MEDIQLNIITVNNTIIIQSTKTKLLKLSYFQSLFEFGEIPKILDVDLLNIKYNIIDKHIIALFDYLNGNNEIKIQIYEYHILLELCDYFGFDNLTKFIVNDIDEYCKTTKFMILLPDNTDTIKKQILCNIHNLYTLFTNTNKINMLMDLLKLIDTTKIQNVQLLNFNAELSTYPLEQTYNISKNIPTIYDNIPQIFELYNYEQILLYSPSNCETYYYPTTQSPKYDQLSLKSDFHQRFATETNNMFTNMNWSNVIIAGGFIFGLVNNINNSIIQSTDIDMYIYGEDTTTTKNYILQYFSQYDPYYVISKNLITIIIPTMKYDIQLIIMNDTNPTKIIHDFDISYVKLYYDGHTVYSALDCMHALKYQVAIFNKVKINIDKRITKTLMKGLKIEINDEINMMRLTTKKNGVYQYYLDDIENCKKRLFIENIRESYNKIPEDKFIEKIKKLYNCVGVIRDYTILTYATMVKSSFDEYCNYKHTKVNNMRNNNYYPTLGDTIILHFF